MPTPTERGNRKLKLLDRIIGIPLIWLLGGLAQAFRKERKQVPASFEPRRIGILMTAAIGDTILVSAVLADLKTKWPRAELVLFLGQSNRGMKPLLRNVTVVEVTATHPIRAMTVIRKSGRFDFFIDTGQWARLNALFTLFAHATYRIGFKTPGQDRGAAYDIQVLHRSDAHELENFRNLAKAVGVRCTHDPDFFVDGRAGSIFVPKNSYAVFHMFAGGQNPYQKEWAKESWKAIADRLPAGWEIVLTGGKENVKQAAEFLAFVNDVRFKNFVGKNSLEKTALILKNAELVLSVNTGILHLAAATGARTVAINGPTNQIRWGPIGPRATSVNSPRFCAPCLNLGFDYACPLDACMKEISVDAAWAVISKSIAN